LLTALLAKHQVQWRPVYACALEARATVIEQTVWQCPNIWET